MKKLNGCGKTGPYGYRCTHHENGEHVARGTEPDSFGEAWPIVEFVADVPCPYCVEGPVLTADGENCIVCDGTGEIVRSDLSSD